MLVVSGDCACRARKSTENAKRASRKWDAPTDLSKVYSSEPQGEPDLRLRFSISSALMPEWHFCAAVMKSTETSRLWRLSMSSNRAEGRSLWTATTYSGVTSCLDAVEMSSGVSFCP